ncbi:MAG: homocysteine S-methyltransferase family protein, partial [candidate division NC10 bacterium]
MAAPFVARLAERPLLGDGAMGTMLYSRGVPLDACFDVLDVNEPKLVQAIHAEYIAAGADWIQTNTFGANRFKLGVHGLAGSVQEINLRGVKLARDVRESMGRDVFVLGSVGPLGKYLAPLGAVEPDEARAAFREQAEGLLAGGVDGFVVETFSDLTEQRLAVEAIRSLCDLPIVATAAFTDESVTFLGRSPVEVVRALRALPVQALGANCSVGSSVLYDVLEQMLPEAGGLPVVIQPNAGLPSRVGERLMYLSSAGLCLAVAAAADGLLANRRAPGAANLGAFGLLFVLVAGGALGARTWERNRDFTSPETLFESALKVVPNSARVHYQLGWLYGQKGLQTKAEEHFTRSLQIDDKLVQAAVGLADAYNNSRNWEKA